MSNGKETCLLLHFTVKGREEHSLLKLWGTLRNFSALQQNIPRQWNLWAIFHPQTAQTSWYMSQSQLSITTVDIPMCVGEHAGFAVYHSLSSGKFSFFSPCIFLWLLCSSSLSGNAVGDFLKAQQHDKPEPNRSPREIKTLNLFGKIPPALSHRAAPQRGVGLTWTLKGLTVRNIRLFNMFIDHYISPVVLNFWQTTC